MAKRVRAAVVDQEVKVLDDLAASAEACHLPAATVGQLARALYWADTPERKEAALTVLRKARTEKPDHFGLTMGLWNYLRQLNRHEEAISYLRAAEALRPQNSHVQLKIADALTKLGRTHETIT